MKQSQFSNSKALLSDDTNIKSVTLTTKNLKQSKEFYQSALRLHLHSENEKEVILGSLNHPFLKIKQVESNRSNQKHARLYHFALIYPDEKALAQAILYLNQKQISQAPTDHGFSKTSYIEDLDGNTIELYIRTPNRSSYYFENDQLLVHYADGRVGNGRDHLNLDELFSTINENEPIPHEIDPNTQIGHVHIFANDVDDMNDFYQNIIGFAEGINYGKFKMADVSLSEAKYHVVAFNGWQAPLTKPKENDLGINQYTLQLNEADYTKLKERLNINKIDFLDKIDSYHIIDPSGLTINVEKR